MGQKAFQMYNELSNKLTNYTSNKCPYPCTEGKDGKLQNFS